MNKLIVSGGAPSPQFGNALPNSASGREPIKHLLLGSPAAIRVTLHRLQVLRYGEVTEWSSLLVLPQHQVRFMPQEGEAIAGLGRYLRLE